MNHLSLISNVDEDQLDQEQNDKALLDTQTNYKDIEEDRTITNNQCMCVPWFVQSQGFIKDLWV